jgi:prepilin-type N-terminal cleavage/methylation domain-containing protein
MSSPRSQHGFTLIEVLVSMSLMLVVFGATLTILDVFQRDNRSAQLRNETQDNARNAMDRLARELRNVAAPGEKYAGALEQAEGYSLTFQTVDPTPGATLPIRVRYCLDDSVTTNEVLWRQTQKMESSTKPALPSSTVCPDLTVSDWETTSRLVEHITNRNGGQSRALFSYGPPSATLVSQFVSVEPTLYLNLTPASLPAETQLTSAVSLRNENRPPTAKFTAVETGPPVVTLNASESVDPDGLALSYKWWEDGTLLSTTAQQFSTEVAAKSTHTFKLEVTDPGGLSSTEELTRKFT